MNVSGKKDPWDSPCNGTSCSTAQGDWCCRGCGRTAEAVDEWATYSKDRRVAENLKAKKRLETIYWR